LIYDFIVVGGGIAGASISYFLKKYGFSVLILEAKSLGYGGSGAAGAFLNWKLDKDGELASLTNSAIDFSLLLYSKYFPNNIHKTPLNLHINDEIVKSISAIVDTEDILLNLTKDIRVEQIDVKNIERVGEKWIVDKFEGKNIFLTTGAFPSLVEEPYLKIRPIWGQRVDIETSTKLGESHHKNISISPEIRGRVRIGATHHRYILNRDIDYSESEQLVEEAKGVVDFKEAKIVQHYGGARSGSTDYFPILGRVVNSSETVQKFPQIRHGRAYPPEEYIYYKNLYLFTGLGGYGYSLAPYLASKFVENLELGKEMGKSIEPYRFFKRWVKKRK
jgi:tRNA 5-methylaminomethyl-2-thiouridine biosynthesis bifunctional protein